MLVRSTLPACLLQAWVVSAMRSDLVFSRQTKDGRRSETISMDFLRRPNVQQLWREHQASDESYVSAARSEPYTRFTQETLEGNAEKFDQTVLGLGTLDASFLEDPMAETTDLKVRKAFLSRLLGLLSIVLPEGDSDPLAQKRIKSKRFFLGMVRGRATGALKVIVSDEALSALAYDMVQDTRVPGAM